MVESALCIRHIVGGLYPKIEMFEKAIRMFKVGRKSFLFYSIILPLFTRKGVRFGASIRPVKNQDYYTQQ